MALKYSGKHAQGWKRSHQQDTQHIQMTWGGRWGAIPTAPPPNTYTHQTCGDSKTPFS